MKALISGQGTMKTQFIDFGSRFLTVIGIGATFKLLFNGITGYYESSIQKPLNLIKRYGQHSYVMITGGGSGIGAQFAHLFASLGFNLILLDRDSQLLDQTTKSLEHFHVEIITETIDFGPLMSFDEYRQVFAKFDKYDISVLINNVGIGIGSAGIFRDTPLYLIHLSFFVNLYPTVYFTKLFMEKNQHRPNQSLVINMSSFAALVPYAYNFQYGACKRFYLSFAESLQVEAQLEQSKIELISFTPAYISTALVNHMKGPFVISTKQFVDSAHRQIGRKQVSIGHWVHRFQKFLLSIFDPQ